MALLAIQGHSTRGKEVISYLKMLGGKNPYDCNGLGTLCAYRIIDGNIQITTIEDLFKSNEYTLYSLEGILAKFPYKVGNKVIYEDKRREITKMVWEQQTNTVAYKLDDKLYCNVINKLQPYKEENMERKNYNPITLIPVLDKVMIIPTDEETEIVQENNKFYLIKKQSKYPKTYEKCCEILNIHPKPYFTYTWNIEETNVDIALSHHHDNLLNKLDNLRILLICRDAYWKIAGDWKPNWTKGDERKYCIVNTEGNVTKWVQKTTNKFLAFPTVEMRDAFYENFEDLIGTCKELL